ncbi:transposase-like zinc-binding domain-containing protein [Budvicia aquatica]|uniref:transposase-like zinc-binding domain-containing protein n=1 Tax=Budvicia aquatica TaxID=82979 RepID=UPI00207FDA5F|nr:hypothetical protein SOASR029_01910 [Budvicia aquatica]
MLNNTPICTHCDSSNNVKKYGLARSGLQRYRCGHCNKTFQAKYIYPAYEENMAKQVQNLLSKGKTKVQICGILKLRHSVVDRYL